MPSNVLYAIDHDLDYLMHDGRPGMSWHKHKFGKWQSQAVYAQGMPNPDAKERTGLKGKIANAKDKIVGAKARFDAKQDAAVTAIRTGGTDTKGARRLKIQSTALNYAVGIPAYMAGRAIGNKVSGINALARRRGEARAARDIIAERGIPAKDAARLTASTINTSERLIRGLSGFGAGAAAEFAAMAIADKAYAKAVFGGYQKRAAGTLKGVKVSDTYAKEYRKTYDDMVKKYSEKVPRLYDTESYQVRGRTGDRSPNKWRE